MASRSELGNYRDAAPDTVAEVAIPPAQVLFVPGNRTRAHANHGGLEFVKQR
jgi:hypothetical protein